MLSQNNNINAHKCCHKKTPKNKCTWHEIIFNKLIKQATTCELICLITHWLSRTAPCLWQASHTDSELATSVDTLISTGDHCHQTNYTKENNSNFSSTMHGVYEYDKLIAMIDNQFLFLMKGPRQTNIKKKYKYFFIIGKPILSTNINIIFS